MDKYGKKAFFWSIIAVLALALALSFFQVFDLGFFPAEFYSRHGFAVLVIFLTFFMAFSFK